METLAVRPLLDLRARDMNVQVGGSVEVSGVSY